MCLRFQKAARECGEALADLFETAGAAIRTGATILILSDRAVDKEYAPIPSLLRLLDCIIIWSVKACARKQP